MKSKFIAIAAIAILGFAVYGNSINGKFLYDDNTLIVSNIYLKSSSRIANIFTEDVGAGASKEYMFYRPIQMLTYMGDYLLWGFCGYGYHLTSIALHILAALALYWFISTLYNNGLLALFTASLFVAHPIHTEAVSYISGRTDPLGFIFLLLSFIFYISYCRKSNARDYFLMTAGYILALLSREASLILPALLLLYHRAFGKKIKPEGFLSICGLTVFYIIFRLTFLQSLLANVSYKDTLLQRLPGVFAAIASYIRLLVFPFDLHMEYGPKLFHFANPMVLIGLLVSASLLFYAFKERRQNKLLFFSVYWFFAALIPLSNLYPINAYMAEHWLYVPSIGFFLILANALLRLYENKKFKAFALSLIMALLIFYSYLTVDQNRSYWKDPITFYNRTLKYSPDNYRVYNNLALEYGRIGKTQEAIGLLNRAIQRRPDKPEPYNNLGIKLAEMGRTEEAIAAFNKSIELDAANARAYYNLGIIYRKMGRTQEAIGLLENAIKYAPNKDDAYNNLGTIYAETGRLQDAVNMFSKAVSLNPSNIAARNNLDQAHKELAGQDQNTR